MRVSLVFLLVSPSQAPMLSAFWATRAGVDVPVSVLEGALESVASQRNVGDLFGCPVGTWKHVRAKWGDTRTHHNLVNVSTLNLALNLVRSRVRTLETGVSRPSRTDDQWLGFVRLSTKGTEGVLVNPSELIGIGCQCPSWFPPAAQLAPGQLGETVVMK